MKKYILICLLILLASLVIYGQSTDITKEPTSYWLKGNPDKDVAWNWMKEIDNNVFGNMGTGKTYYVDSGVNIEGSGETMDSAKNTLLEGINLCTADRGDRIYVAQGHNENGVAATAAIWQASVTGIKIIGLGQGSLKPTFDYDYTSNTCQIAADNVRLHNLRFRPSTSGVLVGLEVTSGSDYAHITKCDFGYPETSTDEFAEALKIGTSTGALVEDNFFDSGAQAGGTAITFEAATGLIIRNNKMYGDCASSTIYNSVTLSEDILIEDNILWQGDTAALNAQPVWEVMTGTVGLARRNYAAANLATMHLAFVGDSLLNFGNYYNESVGGDKTAYAIDEVANTGTVTTITPSTGI